MTDFLAQDRSVETTSPTPPDGDLKLIETIRADDGQIDFLSRNVARLARSAGYCSFPFDAARFRRRVRRRNRASSKGNEK